MQRSAVPRSEKAQDDPVERSEEGRGDHQAADERVQSIAVVDPPHDGARGMKKRPHRPQAVPIEAVTVETFAQFLLPLFQGSHDDLLARCTE